jgi:hypothetical protein
VPQIVVLQMLTDLICQLLPMITREASTLSLGSAINTKQAVKKIALTELV